MTYDRQKLHKEPLNGTARAPLAAAIAPLGEELLKGRARSIVSPRSAIEALRASTRSQFGGHNATGTGDRPNEVLRLSAPAPLDLLTLVAWLIVVEAEQTCRGTLLPLRSFLWARGAATIGRESADIAFSNQALSKVHLEIALDESGHGFIVRDMGSTNGTWLASELGAPFIPLTFAQPLRDSNVLRLGNVVLVFRCFRSGNGA